MYRAVVGGMHRQGGPHLHDMTLLVTASFSQQDAAELTGQVLGRMAFQPLIPDSPKLMSPHHFRA